MKLKLFAFIVSASVAFGQFSWTNQSPAGLADDIWCVTFASETFVATTGKGRVLTSNDGISWSVQTIADNTWLVSVAYGAGLWVVVGDNGSIYYTADLMKWNVAKAVTTSRFNGVAYSGKTFIAVGEQGVIATSIDAQTWTLRTSNTTNYLHGVIATTSTTGSIGSPTTTSSFVVVGGAGTIIQSANEGVSWGPASYFGSKLTENLEAIVPKTEQNSRLAVAVGTQGLTAAFDFTNAYLGRGVTGPLLVNNLRGTQFLQPRVTLRGLVYGSGVFVAAGEQGIIFTSSDGSNWTQRIAEDGSKNLNTTSFLSVAYSEDLQRFVAVGTGGTVLTSSGSPSTFINVSTRGTVTAADPVIGGFVISGTTRKKVLIRAVGPTLADFNVPGVLSDPVLTVYDSSGSIVAKNQGWSKNSNLTDLVAATARVAFPLRGNSTDSALYITLSPGAYTAILTSASNTTGVAMFEAYSP